MPPTPAKAYNNPKMVPTFSCCMSETAAVMVGKAIERSNPVRGRKNARAAGANVPMAVQKTEANAACSIL
jgi:hypothetical protein